MQIVSNPNFASHQHHVMRERLALVRLGAERSFTRNGDHLAWNTLMLCVAGEKVLQLEGVQAND